MSPRTSALLVLLALSAACTQSPSNPATPAQASAPAPATAPATPPSGWAALTARTAALRMTDKFADALALTEQAVTDHPDFWEAHFQHARSYLDRGNRDGTLSDAEKTAHREAAITHYRHALAHGGDADRRVFEELLSIYDRLGLNRPAEGEPVARAMVARHPDIHQSWDWLARILSTLGRHDEAARVFLDARTRLTGDERLACAQTMHTHVRLFEDMAPSDARAVLDAALSVADDAIAQGTTRADYYQLKAGILETRARRVETDPAVRQRLEADAVAAAARAKQLAPADPSGR